MAENKVNISEETKSKILSFFLKTSVPRILEEERKAKKEQEVKSS